MIIENYNDPKQRGHRANDRVQVNGVGRGIQSKSHCISLWISSFLYGNGIPVCYSRPAVPNHVIIIRFVRCKDRVKVEKRKKDR